MRRNSYDAVQKRVPFQHAACLSIPIDVEVVRSAAGKRHRRQIEAALSGLGLHGRIGSASTLIWSPTVWGNVRKAAHVLCVHTFKLAGNVDHSLIGFDAIARFDIVTHIGGLLEEGLNLRASVFASPHRLRVGSPNQHITLPIKPLKSQAPLDVYVKSSKYYEGFNFGVRKYGQSASESVILMPSGGYEIQMMLLLQSPIDGAAETYDYAMGVLETLSDVWKDNHEGEVSSYHQWIAARVIHRVLAYVVDDPRSEFNNVATLLLDLGKLQQGGSAKVAGLDDFTLLKNVLMDQGKNSDSANHDAKRILDRRATLSGLGHRTGPESLTLS